MNFLTILNEPINILTDIEFNGKFIHLEQNYSLEHWNEFFDIELNVRMIILGRPVIEISEWCNYKENEKSYITKHLINKYCKSKLNNFCKNLNGAFTIVILDYNKNKMILITDKVGVFPVYINEAEDIYNFQISTNPDILSRYINKKTLDKVSIAEFINKGFIYHPNTYYSEIKSLDNSSYICWDFSKKTYNKYKYFDFKFKFIFDKQVLIDKFAKALIMSIQRRTTKWYGTQAVMLSGGGDSRTILTNSLNNDIEAITFYDEENFELYISKQITNRLSKKHILIKRNKDYYVDSLYDSVKNNCGMSCFRHDHFIHEKDNKILKKYSSILTGCFADWMFKGIALNTHKIKIFNKEFPISKLDNYKRSFFGTDVEVEKYYFQKILNREKKIFNNNFDLPFEIEQRRIFPLFQEETFTTRISLQREFDWDIVFVDNDIIEVYLNTPIMYKIDGDLYNEVLKKLNILTLDIVHSDKKMRIGTNKYVASLLLIFKKFKNILQSNKNNSSGSWLDYKKYMKNNKKISMIFDNINEDVKIIVNDILGYDLWEMSLDEIIKNDFRTYYNVINFSFWYDNFFKGDKNEK
ncbi:hypothetical protein [Halarcobacter ebronensis]|uniref:asparagine synthase (glutamine-hydrolyzing) n=1 Tax=Halarcobacter ebronensis TaxID=1462615 RepID=A0A4Q1AYA2_9BACT|nr:hypothetical protein [Halarcobacter ebronensis]QKF81102.1 hypothetical protein AEBR_0594 [Halarcobacter ebronensis]RXK06406.1 hypothetical protein CRV07_06860 [Halarcobacter ebronensis]